MLRPPSALRFIGVPFLAIWLCGWAVGELAAGVFLFRLLTLGVAGLDFGPPQPEAVPSDGIGWGELAVSAFLVIWLAGWSAGGYFAARQMFRLALGRERIRVDETRLAIETSTGPFKRRREVPISELQELTLAGTNATLTAVLIDGRALALTWYGTREEREQLLERLRSAARAAAGRDDGPPPGGIDRGLERSA